MKSLKNFSEIGKLLTRKEQKEINGGDDCSLTSSVSYGGCTVATYNCISSSVHTSHNHNTDTYLRYERRESSCGTGPVTVQLVPIYVS